MKIKYITGAVVAIALTSSILGACSKEVEEGKIEEGKVTETSTSLSDTDEMVEQNIDLKDDGSFKEIITGKNNPKVKFEVSYKTDFTDDSWEDVNFEIDKMKVVEVDKFTDDDENEDYKGLISMHYTLENNGEENIHVKPKEGVLILNDGSEVKAEHFTDYWEDVFTKDKKKDGYIYFKFNEFDELNDIKGMKLKFEGRYASSSKDKIDHEYNINLPLVPAS